METEIVTLYGEIICPVHQGGHPASLPCSSSSMGFPISSFNWDGALSLSFLKKQSIVSVNVNHAGPGSGSKPYKFRAFVMMR